MTKKTKSKKYKRNNNKKNKTKKTVRHGKKIYYGGVKGKLLTQSEKEELVHICPICHEVFTLDDDIYKLGCGHIFHQSCLNTLCTTSGQNCPLCRNDIKTDCAEILGIPTFVVNGKDYPIDISKLDLSNTQLTNLPPEIGGLPNLKVLNLSHNQLTTLPAEIGELKRLKHLDLTGNPLTSLPAGIGKTKIDQLFLDNIKTFTNLSEDLKKLKNLFNIADDVEDDDLLYSFLGLDNNNLSVLPATIGGLIYLNSLSLESNNLSILPDELSKLTDLNSLNVANNNFTIVPQVLFKLPNLEWLRIKNNPLTQIKTELDKLESLESEFFELIVFDEQED